MKKEKAIIYHYSRCPTSVNALALLKHCNMDIEIIEYMKTSILNENTIKELLKELNISPKELILPGSNTAQLINSNLSDEQIIKYIVNYPIIMSRPIIKTHKGILICRPSKKVLELVNKIPKKEFINNQDEIIIDENGNIL
ncbi:MAG: ArsC/Spx/MgsR family protein [Psittacicella sp.]